MTDLIYKKITQPNGDIVETWHLLKMSEYDRLTHIHREDGPAKIVHDLYGNIIGEFWLQNGRYHRDGGPASTEWGIIDHKHSILSKRWFKDGVLHREDGPATVIYTSNERIRHEEWYMDGELHRIGGPCQLVYNSIGSSYLYSWYVKGNSIESKIEKWVKQNPGYGLPEDIRNWTNEHLLIFKMVFDWGSI